MNEGLRIGSACLLALLLAAQPGVALAQALNDREAQDDQRLVTESDTRLYLADGTVVMGQLIDHSDDLIIVKVREQVFTFELEQVDRIVTLESLGSGAQTISVTEFPFISFLGGAVAFSLLSWLQFDTASDRDREANLNQASGVEARARDLRDKADRARLIGWTSVVFAAGSAGVALIPRKTTRRIFPELTIGPDASGTPAVHLAFTKSF